MFKRLVILIVAVISVFLLVGFANAGVVKVVTPNGGGGQEIVAGSVYTIEIDVNWSAIPSNARPAKYQLLYTKNGGLKWNEITTRYCSLSPACSDTVPCCPKKYPWEVPFVSGADCKVKVKLFDEKGALIATDKSNESFAITPYGGIPTCGNGILESGEECDHGSLNGTSGNCCSSLCTNLIAPSSCP